MKFLAFLLLCWYALSQVVYFGENWFFFLYLKKLNIPCSYLYSSRSGYLSDLYRAWGEAHGVDVDGRLKLRKYLAINFFLSWIGCAVGVIILLGGRTNP